MKTTKEKLSVLSEMIAFAKVDGLVDSEYDFLVELATELDVDKTVLDALFNADIERVKPKSEYERIVHFHRLVLLMNVDKKQSILEISKLHKIGVGLGLSPAAIEQVLAAMCKYPNNAIPLNVLQEIFKTHHN